MKNKEYAQRVINNVAIAKNLLLGNASKHEIIMKLDAALSWSEPLTGEPHPMENITTSQKDCPCIGKRQMIKLRKRVLSSGFVALEQKRFIPVFEGTLVVSWKDEGWVRVPYVDENGDLINNPSDKAKKG